MNHKPPKPALAAQTENPPGQPMLAQEDLLSISPAEAASYALLIKNMVELYSEKGGSR